MENEIWKDVEGYEKYQISSYGRVKSYNNNNKQIYLKPGKHRGGYYVVVLSKNNIQKSLSVHRLVGKAFIPNPENKPQINHKNGLKTDNNVANLEWATAKENIHHGWKNGLCENSKKTVSIMIELNKKPIYSSTLNMQFESCIEAATYLKSNYFEDTKLGCLQTGICSLLNNKINKSKYDFGWEYVK